ncbi:MAG: sugar phosphate isomerase/epimerase [Spirochaetaceae bacterium]
MKISICSSWFKNRPVEEVISIANIYGLSGIELWSGHIDDYIKRCGHLDGLKKLLKESKLAVVAISPYLNFTQSKERTDESVAEANRCAKYARLLDASIIRIFVGNIPSAKMVKQQWEMSYSALEQICQSNSDLTFALETHYNQPTDRVEVIKNLQQRVGCDNLKVLFDGFNFSIEDIDQVEALEALYNDVVHVHMKNYLWKDRIPTTLFSGDANNKDIVLELIKRGYKGFISLEYFIEDYHEVLNGSVREIKDLCNE